MTGHFKNWSSSSSMTSWFPRLSSMTNPNCLFPHGLLEILIRSLGLCLSWDRWFWSFFSCWSQVGTVPFLIPLFMSSELCPIWDDRVSSLYDRCLSKFRFWPRTNVWRYCCDTTSSSIGNRPSKPSFPNENWSRQCHHWPLFPVTSPQTRHLPSHAAIQKPCSWMKHPTNEDVGDVVF